MSVLERDVDFLRSHDLMDYSVLVGTEKRVGDWTLNEVPEESKIAQTTHNYSTYGQSRILPPSFMYRNKRGKIAVLGAVTNNSHSIYHIGIVDYLQRYTLRKRLETIAKGMRYNSRKISAVPPDYYASRLLKFIRVLIGL
mmetsp:Transcript_17496/g.26049  ORF Transcript_17496/g.26049 Transcript_17496/m.26049 type:complete len:140 (+) Transcript_17496:1-420(+)